MTGDIVARVLVIENMKNTPLGQVAVALAEIGAEEIWIRPHDGEALPESHADYDAMIVLGGEQNALDDDTHPYIPDLAALMVAFGEADKAVLGICLGSQILARAHGGQNHIGTVREFGWHHVTPTLEGRDDPLLAAIDGPFPIFEWHSDTFTLPDNAVRLATNPNVRNQAYRIGRASYGTQFHFEADSAIIEGWQRDFTAAITKMSPHWFEDVAHHKAAFAEKSDQTGLAIARAWVKLINKEEQP